MTGSNNSACNAARLVEHSMLEQVHAKPFSLVKTRPVRVSSLHIAMCVCQSVLDRAVSNVLRQKFALRLFEDVVAPDPSVLDSVAARALSREAATQGIVLLQNKGILPLQISRPANRSKIAVLGLLGGCSEDTDQKPFM
jgi:beta-glucosidase-like glycosyl hydrolase